MTDQQPEFKEIDKQLVGEPIAVAKYTLQPVAQVTGQRMSIEGETGGGAGAWLRVNPVKVIVCEDGGKEYEVSITDDTREAVQQIAQAGLLVAAVCGLAIIGIKILGFRQNKETKR